MFTPGLPSWAILSRPFGTLKLALMGLRPVLVNPRTLVRTWGTQRELV